MSHQHDVAKLYTDEESKATIGSHQLPTPMGWKILIQPNQAKQKTKSGIILPEKAKEELIKKVFSVEFTRFYNYYKKAKDLNISGDDYKEQSKDSVRYFINIGERDDFDWMSLKDFLKDLLNLGKDDVYKVDVKDSFSFFNTDTEHQEMVLSVFNEFQLEGRRVSVEISKDTGRGGRRGGGRDGGGRDRGGRRGDFKKRGDRRGSSDRRGSNDRSGSKDRSGSSEKSGFKGRSRRKDNSSSDNRGTGGRRRRRD